MAIESKKYMKRMPENLFSEAQARRDFLNKAGRFAAVTAPAITLLLGTSLNSRAIAKSGGLRPGDGWGDNNHIHSGPSGQVYKVAHNRPQQRSLRQLRRRVRTGARGRATPISAFSICCPATDSRGPPLNRICRAASVHFVTLILHL